MTDPKPAQSSRPSMPMLALRAEGALVLAGTTLFYAQLMANWWFFFLLLLVPDLSMLGYLINASVGAFVYNLAHTYIAPAILFGIAAMLGVPLIMAISFIWAAHIGMDRMLGYGLKYPAGFKHNHLSKV